MKHVCSPSWRAKKRREEKRSVSHVSGFSVSFSPNLRSSVSLHWTTIRNVTGKGAMFFEWMPRPASKIYLLVWPHCSICDPHRREWTDLEKVSLIAFPVREGSSPRFRRVTPSYCFDWSDHLPTTSKQRFLGSAQQRDIQVRPKEDLGKWGAMRRNSYFEVASDRSPFHLLNEPGCLSVKSVVHPHPQSSLTFNEIHRWSSDLMTLMRNKSCLLRLVQSVLIFRWISMGERLFFSVQCIKNNEDNGFLQDSRSERNLVPTYIVRRSMVAEFRVHHSESVPWSIESQHFWRSRKRRHDWTNRMFLISHGHIESHWRHHRCHHTFSILIRYTTDPRFYATKIPCCQVTSQLQARLCWWT